MSKTVTYSEARATFASLIEEVNKDHSTVLITRTRGDNAVLMSEEDWRSIEETLYLAQSPANAQRLSDAIAELENGGGHPSPRD